MIPPFDQRGNLPSGIHQVIWETLVARYGYTTRVKRGETMIENKRQYGITKNWVKKFQAALHELEQHQNQLHPIAYKAQYASLDSQIATLRLELQNFEALQKSNETVLPSELEVIPERLVRARVASGLTQRQLAERLGMKEQQVQRYEATKYASASFSKVLAIARAIRAAQ